MAEYVNALLKGSKENLETLVTARFQVPAGLTNGIHRVASVFKGTTAAFRQGSSSYLETPVEPPGVQIPAEVRPSRPRWLLPVILALAMILVIMLVVAGWS